jgi:hypothetical protein
MPGARPVIKQDIPFRSDEEILEMVTRFEQCRWPSERWTHRAHLAVAVVYLRQYPFPEAEQLVKQNIQRYNRTCGDPQGYHETITLFFLRVISRFLEDRAADRSIVEIVDELARRCDMAGLREYYSPERLWSAEARGTWIEPDLKPLDF